MWPNAPNGCCYSAMATSPTKATRAEPVIMITKACDVNQRLKAVQQII